VLQRHGIKRQDALKLFYRRQRPGHGNGCKMQVLHTRKWIWARKLLGLLTRYFKVEIGQKLLGHVKQWIEHGVQSFPAPWINEIQEVGTIVDISSVFQLLSQNAHIYLWYLHQPTAPRLEKVQARLRIFSCTQKSCGIVQIADQTG